MDIGGYQDSGQSWSGQWIMHTCIVDIDISRYRISQDIGDADTEQSGQVHIGGHQDSELERAVLVEKAHTYRRYLRISIDSDRPSVQRTV